jgi:hypothetical protein
MTSTKLAPGRLQAACPVHENRYPSEGSAVQLDLQNAHAMTGRLDLNRDGSLPSSHAPSAGGERGRKGLAN